MVEHSFCKGCEVIIGKDEDGGEHLCAHSLDNNDGSCPCTNCLVKTTCQVPCHDFNIYIGDGCMKELI